MIFATFALGSEVDPDDTLDEGEDEDLARGAANKPPVSHNPAIGNSPSIGNQSPAQPAASSSQDWEEKAQRHRERIQQANLPLTRQKAHDYFAALLGHSPDDDLEHNPVDDQGSASDFEREEHDDFVIPPPSASASASAQPQAPGRSSYLPEGSESHSALGDVQTNPESHEPAVATPGSTHVPDNWEELADDEEADPDNWEDLLEDEGETPRTPKLTNPWEEGSPSAWEAWEAHHEEEEEARSNRARATQINAQVHPWDVQGSPSDFETDGEDDPLRRLMDHGFGANKENKAPVRVEEKPGMERNEHPAMNIMATSAMSGDQVEIKLTDGWTFPEFERQAEAQISPRATIKFMNGQEPIENANDLLAAPRVSYILGRKDPEEEMRQIEADARARNRVILREEKLRADEEMFRAWEEKKRFEEEQRMEDQAANWSAWEDDRLAREIEAEEDIDFVLRRLTKENKPASSQPRSQEADQGFESTPLARSNEVPDSWQDEGAAEATMKELEPNTTIQDEDDWLVDLPTPRDNPGARNGAEREREQNKIENFANRKAKERNAAAFEALRENTATGTERHGDWFRTNLDTEDDQGSATDFEQDEADDFFPGDYSVPKGLRKTKFGRNFQ